MLANLISKIHLTTYLVRANHSPSDASHNTVLLSKLCQHVSGLIYTMDSRQKTADQGADLAMVKSFYIHKNFQPLTQTLSKSLSLKDIKNITERDFLKASHLF